MKDENAVMFKIGDKVMRISYASDAKTVINPTGTPQCGVVYVVSEVFETSDGSQCYFVGFGTAPIINGLRTGWMCSKFRRLDEIRAKKSHARLRSSRLK